MATIAYSQPALGQGAGMITHVWAGITGGDVGQPMKWSNLADKTVQVWGTIGAAITIEGSNDPQVAVDPASANWFTLTIIGSGDSASFASAGAAVLAEAPLWIRPKAAAGTTNATVSILANAS